MELLLISDFNDIYALAVGLAIVYMLFLDRKSKGEVAPPFFRFLQQLVETVETYSKSHNTKILHEEEELIAQIDYALDSEKLNDKTSGALSLIRTKAKETLAKIDKEDTKIRNYLRLLSRPKWQHILSWDVFLFGMTLLFIGALENRHHIHMEAILLILCCLVSVLALHCLTYELIFLKKDTIKSWWAKRLRPNYLLDTSLFLLFLAYIHRKAALFNSSSILLNIEKLIYFSIFLCFIEFVLYITYILLYSFVRMIIYWSKVKTMKIDSLVKDHKDDLERYRPELNKLNESLLSEIQSDDFRLANDKVSSSC